MRVFLPRIPKSVARHLTARVALLLLLLASLGVAYWSTFKRYPLIEVYQKKIQSVYALQDEIQTLKAQYPEQLLKETEPGYLRTLELVFTNQEHLKLWQEYFQKRAAMHGLDMSEKLITNRIFKTPKTEIQQLLYEVELKPSKGEMFIPPHERLLMFLHEISTNQFKRIDNIELKAIGDGTNLNYAIIGLQVWYYTNAP
jgi:hypothetical protein